MSEISLDVIIPTYNCAPYIINALDSINNQTMLPDKIIVVDDGSSDNTIDCLMHYKSRVKLDIISQPNAGVSSARNKGIVHSTAQFIALLDADDEWVDCKLEEQINLLKISSVNRVGVIYSRYSLIDDFGNPINHIEIPKYTGKVRGDLQAELQKKHIVTGSMSAVIINKECFIKCGLFDENLAYGEDHDLFLRISEFYNYDLVDKSLVKIRVRAGNAQSFSHKKRMFNNQLYFYNKWIIKFPRNIARKIGRQFIVQLLANLPDFSYFSLAFIQLDKQTKLRMCQLGNFGILSTIIGIIANIGIASILFILKIFIYFYKKLVCGKNKAIGKVSAKANIIKN